MTDRERTIAVAEAVGWLEGFAPTVWLLASLRVDGAQVVADEACAEYETRVAALSRLLFEERGSHG